MQFPGNLGTLSELFIDIPENDACKFHCSHCKGWQAQRALEIEICDENNSGAWIPNPNPFLYVKEIKNCWAAEKS